MSNRAAIVAIYGLMAWEAAWVLALPWPLIPLLVLAPLLSYTMKSPRVRFLAELAYVGVIVLIFRTLATAVVASVLSAVSLGVARSAKLSGNTSLIVGVLVTVVSAFINPWAILMLVPIAALGIWTLVNHQEANGATAGDRMRLASLLAGVAAGLALAAGLIIHVLPWRMVLSRLFAAIAYPFIALLSHWPLHLHPRLPHHKTPKTGPLGAFKQGAGPSHVPVGVSIVFIAAAVIALAVLVHWGWRQWGQTDEAVEPEVEPGIVRETLSDHDWEAPWRPSRPRLTPVRMLVWSRLRRAHRQGAARRRAETFREWLGRTTGSADNQITAIYEAIRYGDAPDTDEEKRHLESVWPKT